jgi:hypothetical protein
MTQPPWSTREGQEAFDFSPIEETRAIRAVDLLSYYHGARADCVLDVENDPAFVSLDRVDGDGIGLAIGQAGLKVLEAEIERLHPGYPYNRQIAVWLLLRRIDAMTTRGHAALQARGCQEMHPELRSDLLTIVAYWLSLTPERR